MRLKLPLQSETWASRTGKATSKSGDSCHVRAYKSAFRCPVRWSACPGKRGSVHFLQMPADHPEIRASVVLLPLPARVPSPRGKTNPPHTAGQQRSGAPRYGPRLSAPAVRRSSSQVAGVRTVRATSERTGSKTKRPALTVNGLRCPSSGGAQPMTSIDRVLVLKEGLRGAERS